MNLGKRYLLSALLALAVAIPVRAQYPTDGQLLQPGALGPGNPQPDQGQGWTGYKILYPFTPEANSKPVVNAFAEPPPVAGQTARDGSVEPATADNPGFYLGIGVIALRRTTLSREAVAEMAPPLSFTSPNPVDLQAVPMPFLLGLRGEVGIVIGPGVLELSGFYMLSQNSSYSQSGYVNPLIFAPLFNSQANFANFPIPAGFNPALWSTTNAPFTVNLNYSLGLGNAELNYRFKVLDPLVLLLGVRYLDLHENLDIQTVDAAGTTDYTVATHSRIIAPQVGFELEFPLIWGVSVEFTGKAAVGANFYEVDHALTQSAGPPGPGSNAGGMQLSGIIELGLFANIWFTENFKLHAGYQVMWILNAPEAQSQVNFDTTVGTGTQNYSGSFFFQGPAVEVMWLF